MNFEDRVVNELIRRVNSGQNIEAAISFKPETDFPGVSKEELSEYRSRWYVNKYRYGHFSLKLQYAKSILEEHGIM